MRKYLIVALAIIMIPVAVKADSFFYNFINNATPAGTLNGSELVPVTKGGSTTFHTTTQAIANLGGGGGGSVSITSGNSNIVVSPSPITGTGVVTMSGSLSSLLSLTTSALTVNGNSSTTGTATFNNVTVTGACTGCGGGGGSTAFSALTAASTSNTIQNGSNAQVWNWDTNTSGNALTLSSTGLTSGNLLNVSAANVAGTGAAGFFSNTATAGYGVFSQGNAGVSGYLAITSTSANAPVTGIYSPLAGTLQVTTSGASALNISTTQSVGIGTSTPGFKLDVEGTSATASTLQVATSGNATFVPIANFFAPSLSGGNQVYEQFGRSATAENSAAFSFNYAGAGNVQNNLAINMFGADPGVAVFGIATPSASGSVRIGNVSLTPAAPSTPVQMDGNATLSGTLNIDTTSATKPKNGLYLSAANTLDITTSGNKALEFSTTGDGTFQAGVFIPNIASDATLTDATVCEDTTNHKLWFGSGTAGICLGTSSLRYKRDVKPQIDGLDQIVSLKPVNFFYRPGHGDGGAREQYGFLAEDVVKVIPKLTGLDSEGKPNSVDLLGMVPILVKAMQEQQQEIDELQKKARRASSKGK